jgi:hypothetical protein
VYYGIKTGLNKAFVIDQATWVRLISEDPRSGELIKPFAIGREIKRYAPIKFQHFLIFIPKGWTNKHRKGNAWKWFACEYPAISKFLQPYEQEAGVRGDKGDYWWELRACDYYDVFTKDKIIYPNICKQPEFTYNDSGLFTNQKCFIIPSKDLYLLGILNSTLSMFLFTQMFPKLRGGFYEPGWVFLKNFPIKPIDTNNPMEVQKRDQIISHVKRLLELSKQIPSTPIEADQINSLFSATGNAIDRLTYKLYGLSDEEIKIVELAN